MLRKYLPFIFSGILILLWPVLAFSQDPGVPDTAIVECVEFVRPNSQVILNVYTVNDSALVAFHIPLAFPDTVTHLDITCDSISFVGTRAASATMKSDLNSIDNATNRLVAFAIWFAGSLPPGSVGDGPVAKIYFTTGPTWDSTQYVPVDTMMWPPSTDLGFLSPDPEGDLYVPAFIKGCLGAGFVIANFSGSPRAGYKPLNVEFTDSSIGTPTSWHWNFGDGETDTVQNPMHTYNEAGYPRYFDVELIISNLVSTDTINKPNYIAVYESLTVDFTAQPTEGRKPLTVSFQSLCKPTPDSVTWYFGDDSISNQLNPEHQYTDYGNFDVKLVAQLFGYIDSLIKEDYILVSETLTYTAYSPVDLIVTDPNGDSIGVDFNTIPDASYDDTTDVNQDEDNDDRVIILNPVIGEYMVRVVGEPGGDGGNYTLAVKIDGNEDTPLVTAAAAPGPEEVDTVFYPVTEYLRGDPDRDGTKSVGDVIFLINYLFKNGPPPEPLFLGDVDYCEGENKVGVNVSDVIYLINYLFKNGKAPCS